jgi:hypothetical protein
MEIIKRKILLEQSIDRNTNSPTWGVMTATTFYLNIMITQNVDDMGLFTDMSFIKKTDPLTPANYSLLITKLQGLGLTFPFMTPNTYINVSPLFGTTTESYTLRYPNSNESTYYNFGNKVITGATDSKLEDVKAYSSVTYTDIYRAGFSVATEDYVNYAGVSVSGVNQVFSIGEPTKYVFDAITGSTLGQNNQPYGLQYADYTGTTRAQVVSGDTNPLPLTTFRYIGEGWNQTNVSLSALTKEEFLFGIISRPELQNDVFIERGTTSVMDSHLKLSEIKNLGQLSEYGNGFYKINKQ